MTNWRDRLAQAGLSLPSAPLPNGRYRPVTVWENLAYVSGQVSRIGDSVIVGPVDENTDPETIKLAAEAVVLRALAAIEVSIGIDRVRQILFLRGFVHATPAFADHSAILDHASELLVKLLGDAGEHSRSAIGVSSLPGGGMLEIELVAAITAQD